MMQLERIQAGGTLFKSSCCRTLGLAFLLLAWVWALAPPQALARGACAGETAAVSSSPAPDLRASVLCLVNEARLEHGLPALQQDPRLQAAAQRHTDDMVANHYFAHDSRDGTPFSQRITAAGYQWAATGENIAQGPSTPQLVVQSWIAEPSALQKHPRARVSRPGRRSQSGYCQSGGQPRNLDAGLRTAHDRVRAVNQHHAAGGVPV